MMELDPLFFAIVGSGVLIRAEWYEGKAVAIERAKTDCARLFGLPVTIISSCRPSPSAAAGI